MKNIYNLIYNYKTTVIFFSDFHWHDLGFLGKILIFLGFLGKIKCQDLSKKSKKSKILAINEKKSKIFARNSRLSKILASWQENQDAKHWVQVEAAPEAFAIASHQLLSAEL